MRHSLARIAFALLATAGVACSDSPGLIGDESGTYVLRSIGDSSVPIVQYASGGYASELLADTLELDGHGNYTRATVVVETRPGEPPAIDQWYTRQPYTRHGNILSIAPFCPPNALCARPLVGYVLVPSGIRSFSLDDKYPQPVSRFERVR